VQRALLVPVGLEHDLDAQGGDGQEGRETGPGEGDGVSRDTTSNNRQTTRTKRAMR
jgi:hypothetical protein